MSPQPMTLSDLAEIVAEVRTEVNSVEHEDHTTAAAICQLALLDTLERVVAARIMPNPPSGFSSGSPLGYSSR